MVTDLERFGRKNGKGSYVYPEDGSSKHLWAGLGEHFPLAENQPSLEDVKNRLIMRQVIECARCFEEGVLPDARSGDIGAIFGWGFAPFSGGPFSYLDSLGLDEAVRLADQLAADHGERFATPKLLRDMADKGESFYTGADTRGKTAKAA